ncbi:hypothetical protein EHP00_1787 [Ecytonucleospora hepatopenaei]|uniref:Uncharacterized protein n=1 Tax=Ecytonucleospora hepatopenaei TaxID=646526 RepID=A0A1W0E302_9MICR|nr:hypothetical protein EHP00_1787 [Ecytonucleospora hepatopenaei]
MHFLLFLCNSLCSDIVSKWKEISGKIVEVNWFNNNTQFEFPNSKIIDDDRLFSFMFTYCTDQNKEVKIKNVLPDINSTFFDFGIELDSLNKYSDNVTFASNVTDSQTIGVDYMAIPNILRKKTILPQYPESLFSALNDCFAYKFAPAESIKVLQNKLCAYTKPSLFSVANVGNFRICNFFFSYASKGIENGTLYKTKMYTLIKTETGLEVRDFLREQALEVISKQVQDFKNKSGYYKNVTICLTILYVITIIGCIVVILVIMKKRGLLKNNKNKVLDIKTSK